MHIKNRGQLILRYLSFGGFSHLEDIGLLFLFMSPRARGACFLKCHWGAVSTADVLLCFQDPEGIEEITVECLTCIPKITRPKTTVVCHPAPRPPELPLSSSASDGAIPTCQNPGSHPLDLVTIVM